MKCEGARVIEHETADLGQGDTPTAAATARRTLGGGEDRVYTLDISQPWITMVIWYGIGAGPASGAGAEGQAAAEGGAGVGEGQQ